MKKGWDEDESKPYDVNSMMVLIIVSILAGVALGIVALLLQDQAPFVESVKFMEVLR